MTPRRWPPATVPQMVVEPFRIRPVCRCARRTTPIVVVIDADGSMDGDLPKLVAELKGADLVTGRRRPVAGLHHCWSPGTVVMSWRLRTRHRLPVYDIAPMRVARREAPSNGVVDRRQGPAGAVGPLCCGGPACRRILDAGYGPRTGGKPAVSEGCGAHHRDPDFWKVIRERLPVSVLGR